MRNGLGVALLVEDNADTVDMYARFLTHVGFQVITALTASEGYKQALARSPDVVVTDVRFPGGPDGLALTATLRLDKRTTHIPIIVLTSGAFPADRARAEAAGCDVFLTKPCLPDELATQAQALISPPRNQTAARAANT